MQKQVFNKQSQTTRQAEKALLTGARLRGYAFALLAKREYSKGELLNKLLPMCEDATELQALIDELAQSQYQSDQRVAEQTVASQLRQGKGLAQIKNKLTQKQLDQNLVAEELAEIDWLAQAYALKCKKFGIEVATEPKTKAKQVRFLQYRGFDLNTCFQAIAMLADDEEIIY